MKITGQYLWTDYLEALFLHTGLPRTTRAIVGVAVPLFALSVIAIPLLNLPPQSWFVSLVPAGILALYLAYVYYFLPRQAKRLFDQQKELFSPFEMEFSDAGLNFSNEFGHTLRPWKIFYKWKENKKLFMLYQSEIVFTMIPKRLLADSNLLDTVKQYLSQNSIPSAVKHQSSMRPVLLYLFIIFMIAVCYYQFLVTTR